VIQGADSVKLRTVGEWSLEAERDYAAPYADVFLDAQLTSPSGRQVTMPGFYDGDSTWRIRFNPDEVGQWRMKTVTRLADPGLNQETTFTVSPNESRGFVKTTPGKNWGFAYENGEPIFVFGDTFYNAFGMAYNDIDVVPFLERRAAQGFNMVRIRFPVSYFHPPRGYNLWQTKRLFPWGGSEQMPRFDQINLDYFRVADRIIEGWGFEFPFNSRNIFTAEWEELWLRYLIARYDAYPSTWFWTPLNEYEYYPNGDWNYQPISDRFQMRVARWIKATAPHGHPVACHNGPRIPPFAERFQSDPAASDLILFQEWGTREEDNGWLAAGIEESIANAFNGWSGSGVLAEWGYERNQAFDNNLPHHEFCDEGHTRRGAWRGAMSGYGLITGFENSWGPWALLDVDQQPGIDYLLVLHKFFTEVVPFQQVRPVDDLLEPQEWAFGSTPSALASKSGDLAVVYLPTGGSVTLLRLPKDAETNWFDPRTGEIQPAFGDGTIFSAPTGGGERPDDWVLLVEGGAQ
jgi:hypothetical protein